MALSKTKAGVEAVNKHGLFSVGLIAVSILILSWGLSTLPVEADNIAIDWKHIWKGTQQLQAGYGTTELRTPPWALIFIWPITLFNFKFSWALAASGLLIVLIISVPKTRNKAIFYLSIFLLVLSYPTLRQIVDGNLEILIIGGVLVAVKAIRVESPALFALALLLLSAKIQESWLLLPALAAIQWTSWQKGKREKAYLIAAIVALPLLAIYGQSWLKAMQEFSWPGTLIDASLLATAGRLAWSPAFTIFIWALVVGGIFYLFRLRRMSPSRESFSLLVSAALLLGPYAASNSILTPLALGVIPFFQKFRTAGLLLISLYFLPYLRLTDASWRFSQESNYWTFALLATYFAQIAGLVSVKDAEISSQSQD